MFWGFQLTKNTEDQSCQLENVLFFIQFSSHKIVFIRRKLKSWLKLKVVERKSTEIGDLYKWWLCVAIANQMPLEHVSPMDAGILILPLHTAVNWYEAKHITCLQLAKTWQKPQKQCYCFRLPVDRLGWKFGCGLFETFYHLMKRIFALTQLILCCPTWMAVSKFHNFWQKCAMKLIWLPNFFKAKPSPNNVNMIPYLWRSGLKSKPFQSCIITVNSEIIFNFLTSTHGSARSELLHSNQKRKEKLF